MITGIRVTCHQYSREWTYMGTMLALAGVSNKPVRIPCPTCPANAGIDRNKNRDQVIP